MAFGITTFSEAPFAAEGSLDTNVAVTGISISSNTGNVTITATQNPTVQVTGETINTFTGNLDANPDANPAGEELTSVVADVGIKIDVDASVTGEDLTIVLGDESIVANANVDVTGEELTTAVDDVTTIANANIDVTSVSASVSLPSPLVFTGFGDAQISTAQSKFGGASLLLDGTGDYLESEGAYNFGGDPFTIDMWVRPTSGTQDAVFFDSRDSLSNNAIALRQASDNLLVLRANGTLFNINNVFSANTWVHIAVTRGDPFGNTYSVFVNGVKQGSSLFGVTATAANIHIGSDFNGSNNWEGYIDELRVADVDEYGGTDFTPPTSAYTADGNVPILLHFDGVNGSTTFTNSGFVDSVTITADANIDVTGEDLTLTLGDAESSVSIDVAVTGEELTTAEGSVTVDVNTPVDLTGQELTVALNNPLITAWSNVDPDVTNTWTEVNTEDTNTWREVDIAA